MWIGIELDVDSAGEQNDNSHSAARVHHLLGGAAVAWRRARQQARRWSGISSGSRSQHWISCSFQKGLSETGYVEGQNVVVEYRFADGYAERLPAMATDLSAVASLS